MKISSHRLTGAAIAAAVALAFGTASTVPALASSQLVNCPGVNACKGQSACRNTTNTCKVLNQCMGQNACKGQGHLMVTKAECIRLGGHGVTYEVPPNAVNSLPYPSTNNED